MNAFQLHPASVAAGCVYCHAPLNPSRPTQKVCLAVACRRRKALAAQTKRYWANPEKYRSRQRDRYRNDPAFRKALWAAQDRYRTFACSRCGKELHYNLPVIARPTYVCGQCKSLARRELTLVTKPCWFCNEPMQGTATRLKYERCRCQQCSGILTRTGREWGVSRERVRQIVETNFATGLFESRLVALRAADAQRRLPPAPQSVKSAKFPEFPPFVLTNKSHQQTMSPEEVAIWTKAMTS